MIIEKELPESGWTVRGRFQFVEEGFWNQYDKYVQRALVKGKLGAINEQSCCTFFASALMRNDWAVITEFSDAKKGGKRKYTGRYDIYAKRKTVDIDFEAKYIKTKDIERLFWKKSITLTKAYNEVIKSAKRTEYPENLYCLIFISGNKKLCETGFTAQDIADVFENKWLKIKLGNRAKYFCRVTETEEAPLITIGFSYIPKT